MTDTANEQVAPLVQVDSNPFAFSPEQLMDLIDPKNLDHLKHLGNVDGILKGLHVDPEVGLVDDSVITTKTGPSFEDRQRIYGKNTLPPAYIKSIFELMWAALQDKVLILLSIAALVSLGVGISQDVRGNSEEPDAPKTHWIEGFAIIIAVIIVVLVGSVNDYQKERQFRALNAKKEDRLVKVFRNSKIQQISIYHVLVGDIILLEPGDMTCADGIFLSGMNLRVDESAATGESDTIKKSLTTDPFILSGSKVSEGMGRYIVTAVGERSFFGKTMMALRTESEETPLQIKLDILAERIAKIGLSIGIVMLIVLILKYVIATVTGSGFGNDNAAQESSDEIAEQIINVFIAAITVIVVAVPEGLPLAVTLALAYATKRMLKDNNLVRVLSACETMGGATTVCSDKTGTLTQNKMTVVQGVIAKNISFSNEAEIKSMKDRLKIAENGWLGKNRTLNDIYHILTESIAINSTAFEEKSPETQEIIFVGSKTETALLEWIHRMGVDYKSVRDAKWFSIEQVYPFSSERKSMATLIKIDPKKLDPQTSEKPFYRIFVKGASEIVLKYCEAAAVVDIKYVQSEQVGSEHTMVDFSALNADLRQDLLKLINSYAEESLRTICLAYRDIAEEDMISWLKGPIRQKVAEAKLLESQKEEVPDGLLIRDADTFTQVHHGGSSSQSVQPNSGGVVTTTFTRGSDSMDAQNNAKRNIDDVSSDLKEISDALTDAEILSHPLTWSEIGATKLICLGVVGIEDPLRPGVPEAVAACQNAGVVVRMVTGDNILTAKAIATKCGIFTKGGIAMEGAAFRKLSIPEMDALLPRLQVLARSSPTDKQLLVGRLKALGETVAVTGDGTNDGPALKMADIGFSMGIAGTEVAKEASSIILMDDNFSSIVKAMMWGRAVNDAVKKFLQFQLTVNITAVIIAFVSAILDSNETSVLTAVQLLWVNLIMDSFAALALATEPPSLELLDRPPENKKHPLISFSMWKMILGQSVFQLVVAFILLFAGPGFFGFAALSNAGGFMSSSSSADPIAIEEKVQLRTIVFNTFVFMQVFNQINCRRLDNKVNVFKNIHRNPFFFGIFIIILAGQLIIVFFGGQAFKTRPLTGGQWAACILIGFLSLPWGLVLRLLPDELFQLFGIQTKPYVEKTGVVSAVSDPSLGSPNMATSRGNYPTATSPLGSMGLYMSSDKANPQVDATIHWNNAVEAVRSELSVFRTIRGTGRLGDGNRNVTSIDSGHTSGIHSMMGSQSNLAGKRKELSSKNNTATKYKTVFPAGRLFASENSGIFGSGTSSGGNGTAGVSNQHQGNGQHFQPSMAAIAGIGIGLAGYGFVAEPVKLERSSRPSMSASPSSSGKPATGGASTSAQSPHSGN